jgi:hypothetical protein
MHDFKSYKENLLHYLNLSLDPYYQQIPKYALRQGTIHHLYGTRFIFDDRPAAESSVDFEPPKKDFSKAKTQKERLEARLNRKKGKPSSLLSKLVSKK